MKLKMFVCGPTVYDYIHIGNARTFVIFDSYAKWLRSPSFAKASEGKAGVDLEYIMNITDIDDKIIARAKEQNREPAEFAKEWEEKFYEDAKALNITSPTYKRAMDHVPEILDQVKRLILSKHVYEIENDGFYFDLSTFADYGKLSGRTDIKDDDAVSRIDENENKRNKGDFCVWKGSLEDGRPGWHIEDTAITEKYFGPQYDIHGGGMDLMFPHHEAELAIMESISGLKPFVQKWMHAGFLVNSGKRMGKSNANFMTAHEALEKYSPETLRFYFLSAHYKSPLDYTETNIKQAEAATMRLGEIVSKIGRFEDEMLLDDNPAIATIISQHQSAFEDALDEDFNTPKAFGVLFELLKNMNPLMTKRKFDLHNSKRLMGFFTEVNAILGIVPQKIEKLPKTIDMVVDQRERARASKDYELSDKLRKELEDSGYLVDDTAYGPLVKKK